MAERTTDDDTLIPDSLKSAAKEIAAVCRKYKLRSCDAKLSPGFRDQFHDDLTFSWEEGRHGEEADVASLTYTRNIRITVE